VIAMPDPIADLTTADQISRVISLATAPSFLLGAVASFVSVLIGRLNRIADRSATLVGIPDDDQERAFLKAMVPRLRSRMRMMNQAIEFAVISAICTTILVILAFTTAFLNLRHEYGAGVMFIVALGFFAAALVSLWREVRAARNDSDFQI